MSPKVTCRQELHVAQNFLATIAEKLHVFFGDVIFSNQLLVTIAKSYMSLVTHTYQKYKMLIVKILLQTYTCIKMKSFKLFNKYIVKNLKYRDENFI